MEKALLTLETDTCYLKEKLEANELFCDQCIRDSNEKDKIINEKIVLFNKY